MNKINIFSTGASKLLVYKSYLKKWYYSKNIAPITLEIQPSERCNHHCPLCQSKMVFSNKKVKKLAKDGAYLDCRLLSSIWQHKPKGVVFSGNTGDPLLHPNIVYMLEQIFFRNIPSVLITNGQALTPELHPFIIKCCQGIRISLDADGPNLYKTTHGVSKNCWNEVVENILTLLANRKRMGLNKEQCLIGVGFLTGKKTKHKMESATKFARELGVDYIQFRPFHNDNSNIRQELEICQNYITDTFNVLGSFQKYDQIHSYDRTYRTCHGAWFYSVLDANGNIYICCHNVGNPNAFIGSLREMSWTEILNSRRRRDVIQNFSLSNCLQNCRLDSHNRFLESLSLSKTSLLPNIQNNQEILKHAPFL